MAQAHRDSSFELALVPITGPDRREPTGAPDKVVEIPMLDLNSSGPLPNLPDERPLQSPAPVCESPSMAALSLSPTHGRPPRAPGSMWLQGDVLMCPCPDCAAPMSVRTWLMIADCWKCGTSIELTEEQEREARRLLREREAQQRGQRPRDASNDAGHSPAAGSALSSGNGAAHQPASAALVEPPLPTDKAATEDEHTRQQNRQTPAEETRPDREQTERRRRRSAAARPVGARAKIRKMAVAGATRVWISEVFGNMPAWLVSFVFHAVLLIVLSLLYFDDSQDEENLLLLTEISTQRVEGGDPQAQLATDDVVFDLPVPSEDYLTNEAKRQVLLKADQDARPLRLDPDNPTTDLPPLDKVQNLLQSEDTVRRTFAARDPRMRVEMVKAEGGTTLTEAAVARALRFLAQEQNDDGGWGRTLGGSDVAGASLALLPFLGAGQTHQSGVYQDNVAMGLRWLIKHQKDDGDLRHNLLNNAGMYAHGQGTIVLSEAYALTGDEQLRGPAQKAVDFIVAAQHVGGGWRYQPGEAGDTSVLGWQLMALHSARVSGLNVPETTLELASNYLDTVQSAGGSKYSYRRGTAPNAAMSAEGLLCRMYTGWNKQNPALEEGLGDLLDSHMPQANAQNIYYWYYGTQVAHHMGGEQWGRWNDRIKHILVESQVDGGRFAGAWRPSPSSGDHAQGNDWIYTTSLAACCLEVYYRHAPLFRQIELQPR